MQRFLLTLGFLLWFASSALALPSYCTLTGTVLSPDGTACAACKITITTAGNQEVGGSTFPGGKARSWTTESDGDLPAGVEAARTLIVKIQIDKGATVTVQIPDTSTADISTLLLEPIDVPTSTNINSLSGTLSVTKGGTGAAPDGDDQVMVSTSATGADWETLPDCDGVTKALNYDVTTNTFTCNSTVSATDLVCTGCVADTDLASDSVTEAKLAVTGAPTDEYCLTYEGTGPTMEWQVCGGSSGYSTVMDEGVGLTARTTIDFAGAGVTCADSGGTKTLCTIGGGGAGNSFETMDTSSGTFPVADSATDTLFVDGTSPVVVTGDVAADSLTFSILANGISSTELADTFTATTITSALVGNVTGNADTATTATTATTANDVSDAGIDLILPHMDGAGLGINTATTPDELVVETTEITGARTWNDSGVSTSAVWTFDVSGTNPVITIDAGAVNVSTGTLQQGGVNVVTTATDDDVPEAADYSNLTAGTGITNSPTGTINATLGTAIISSEITDATIAQVDIDDTQTLAGNPDNGASSVWFATTGLIWEGATAGADNIEGLLVSADLTTTDKTWTLPNVSGNICTDGAVCSGYQAAGTYSDITSTPANNQVAVWTDANTLEGDPKLTLSGTILTLGDLTVDTSVSLATGLTGINDPVLDFSAAQVDCSNCRFTLTGGTKVIPDAGAGGTTTNVPYWSDTDTLTDEPAFTYNSGTNTLTAGTFSGALSGNVTGNVTGNLTGIASDLACASSPCVANSETTAVSTNTNSAIVTRDGSGDFSAGTITASLTGAASLNTLLAGRTGSTNDTTLSTSATGTLYGSAAAANNLTLQANSNSNSTGTINLNASNVSLDANVTSITADRYGLTISPTTTYSGTALKYFGYHWNPTVNLGSASSVLDQIGALRAAGTISVNSASFAPSQIGYLMSSDVTSTSSVTTVAPEPVWVIRDGTIIQYTTTGTATAAGTDRAATVVSLPTIKNTSTGTLAWQDVVAVRSLMTVSAVASGTTTVANRYGLKFEDVTKAAAGGTETVTAQYAIDIDPLSNAVTNVGLRNADTTVYTPTGTETVGAAFTLTATSTVLKLDASTARTSSTTTAINDGVADGQVLYIMNVDSADVITIDAGANTDMGAAASCALNAGGVLHMIWSSDRSDWLQVSCSVN